MLFALFVFQPRAADRALSALIHSPRQQKLQGGDKQVSETSPERQTYEL